METNYNIPSFGEIDIISQYEDMLVFTEIKTQTPNDGVFDFSSQEDEMRSHRIMNAMHHYIESHELNCNFRFDIGEVVLGKGKPKINIKENFLNI